MSDPTRPSALIDALFSRFVVPSPDDAPPVAHHSDENTPRGVSEGYTRRNGAEKP